MAQPTCSHLDQLKTTRPNTPEGCEECLASGDAWVHLRLCVTCGHVGCCDGSKNHHATRHHQGTGHPLIASYQPGENWMWCYPDELFMETEKSIR
ncbi:MAG TPA: UBP-type zinc finger domain-containing protein [Candidatus Dormibacteraeota bacterium]|nr:UBP-type zinc finger domain-containing protein [Candidatus Dormibacteraeota bacterium]